MQKFKPNLSLGVSITLIGCVGLLVYLWTDYSPTERFFLSLFIMLISAPSIRLLIGFTLKDWGVEDDAAQNLLPDEDDFQEWKK